MTKSVFAIAALAAALSTAAFAADVKSTQPTPMTDAQMDAVTAGSPGNSASSNSLRSCGSGSVCVQTGYLGNQGNGKPVGNAGLMYCPE